MVVVWCSVILVSAVLFGTGVMFILGRRRLAQNIRAARGPESTLTAAGALSIGILAIGLSIVLVAAILLNVVPIDGAAARWDAILRMPASSSRLISIGVLAFAIASFVAGFLLARNPWKRRDSWGKTDSGAIRVPPALVAGSVFMLLGLLAVPTVVLFGISSL